MNYGNGQFSYDSLGNIRAKDLGSRHIELSYNSDNRLTRSVDSGGLGGNTGTRDFSYDSRGNTITAGNLNFTFDYADQPTSMYGSTSGSYRYDGNLKRVKATIEGKTLYNVYNLAGKLIHIDNVSSNKRTDYINAGSMTVARVENNVPTYVHHDSVGSPVSGTNAAGAVLWRERYTPYGITLDNAAANDDQAGYTGHIKDSDTGLVYMQARYYDPVIGRFYSNDPVGAVDYLGTSNGIHGFNRYAYVNNNPYKYTDPTGKFAQFFIGAFVGAVAELASQAIAGKGYDLGKVGASAMLSGVTGGLSYVGKGLSAGKHIFNGSLNATGAAGESMIHDSIDGNSADLGKALTSAVTSVPMIGNGSTLGKILGDGAGKKLESMGASENTAQLIGDTAKGLTASGVKGVENSARSSVPVVRVSGRIESKRLDK